MKNHLRLAFSTVTIAALAACGGGGDSTPVADAANPAPAPALAPAPAPAPAPTPAPTPIPKTNVTISVIDGAIQNATVCLDANLNSLCDSEELQGKTDASGKLTLAVPDSDLGKHPVVAIVGTDAIDADSGAVPVAYTLKAPADKPGVVSPLTTLAQQTVESLGVSSDQAAKVAQDQIGTGVSTFSDFTLTRATDANAATVSRLARLMVLVMQQQTQTFESAIGKPDSAGGTIARADVGVAIRTKLGNLLASAAAAAGSDGLTAACATGMSADACKTALATAATTLVGQSQLTAGTLPVFVGVQKLMAVAATATGPAPTPTAGFSLDFVNYGDANNWYYRVFTTSASGAVPDANGLLRYRDERAINVAGTITPFAYTSDPLRQGDVHWNGTSWITCSVGTDSTATVRDIKGFSTSDSCSGQGRSVSQRVGVDITGQPMAGIVTQIQTTRNSSWGTPPSWYAGTVATATSLGATTFPAGSVFYHQNSTDLDNALAYDPRSSNQMTLFTSEVAAGGDGRITPQPACAAQQNTTTLATSLDTLVSQNKGTPCIFAQQTVTALGSTATLTSLNPSENWQNSTLSIGVLGSAAISVSPQTSYYTSNTMIRVAFTGSGANAATYYSCKQRWTDGIARNCTMIGIGSYSIATSGDARVMTLVGAPAQAAPLTYNRVFVERGGKVYFGYQNKLTAGYLPRLNSVAANALFTKVGMPTITP